MKVWVLVIEHRHGFDVFVHRTQEGARQRLLAFVLEWWDREMDGAPQPDSPDLAIDMYFEENDREFYSLDDCVVAP